jgi:hypothetical protein
VNADASSVESLSDAQTHLAASWPARRSIFFNAA